MGRACLILLLAFLGACTESVNWTAQQAGTPTVSTDQTSYTQYSPITATWTGTAGYANDWICIVYAGSPPDSGFVALTYTNGAVDGSYTFTNGVPAGNYEIRSYVGGSYTIIASSTFTVTSGAPPPPTAQVTTNKSSYRRNESIAVTWANTPGNVDDWIAIVPAGSPSDSGFLALTYTNGQQNGTYTFNGLPNVGDYEVRAYRSGSYQILGTATFSVTSITTDATTYTINSPITLNWAYNPGNANDYVTVNTAGSPADSGFVLLAYTNGVRTGSTTFTQGLPAGNYEARSYRGGSYEILDSTPITVAGNPPPPPSFTTDQTAYTSVQSITVSWISMPGRSQDWVALVPAGSPANSGFLQLSYVNGEINGSRVFNPLPAGSYEARYYQEGSYTILAMAAFTVSNTAGGTCTPPANPPVVSGISSGDLVLDSTQQENTVAMTVPLGSSILFTSTREAEPSPNYGGVMCTLHDVDATTNTPAGITCIRNAPGTDTGSGTIVVHYSVVSFSSGVTVQRGVANTGFTNPSTISLTSVNPSESFVLLNGIAVGGSGWGNNEFARAALVDATTLDVRTAVAGSRVSWQVVDMAGASVQRGTASLTSNGLSVAANVSTTPSGTFVLASYTTQNGSGIAAGALSVATSMSDSSTVLFQRDLSGTAIDISYEVVSMPFATFSGTASMSAGQSSSTASVTGMSSSSVGICSSQAILGQSTGSTSYSGSSVDLVGEAAVALTTSAGSVSLQRSSSSASAEFPWTVLDFGHNCNGQ